MEYHFSEKALQLEEGIFAALNTKKAELLAKGRTIYNLSVGTPDFKPAPHIMEAVSRAALLPENYRYSLTDLPELIQAVQGYYRRRFSVELRAEEIMTVYGSQEGMAHFAWALCDPGDLVLVPNPGYPIFRIGPELCGAVTWEYPLLPENHFLPKLEEIPEDIARKARFMVVNYPGNPTCTLAPDSFYRELIAFAQKYNIIILHDNAYADLVYGGKKGTSLLAFEGGKEAGVEFYSLSKTYNYTGARLSFVLGNEEVIRRFRALRTQFDYGIFLPVQYGGIAALNGPDEPVRQQAAAYEERCRVLCSGLRKIGWQVKDSEGTMFVWAPLPAGYRDSFAFCLELMERSGVICVPGSSFGSLGEGYVRMALVLPPDQLEEAVESIRGSGIIEDGLRSAASLLAEKTGEARVLQNEPMSRHTTFRIGGPADLFVLPESEEEIRQVRLLCREYHIPLYLEGNGSNLLISDRGLRGVVMQLSRNFSKVSVEGTVIRAKSGALLSSIASLALKNGLAGMEFAAGIPGTLGGAVTMNAGAYGGEMKDILKSVRVLDADGNILTLTVQELELGYRTSCIEKKDYFVLDAEIELKKDDPEAIHARMEDLRIRRQTKQPLDMPSAGSTFKRPTGYFAGKLIEDAGLRGYRAGGAQVSEKHCGFVVNTGNATCEDVRRLICEIQKKVRDRFGVDLETEVRFWEQ